MGLGQQAMLSLKGLTGQLPPCLNYVVGRLYEKFDEAEIDRKLAGVVDASEPCRKSFDIMVQEAKDYYKDPGRYDRIFNKQHGKREKNDTKAVNGANASKAAAKTKNTANRGGTKGSAKVVAPRKKAKQKEDLTTIYPFPGLCAACGNAEIAADPLVICVTHVIEVPYCYTAARGRMVCGAIIAAMERGQQVVLSFEGVDGLALGFLHGVLSGLFENFSEEAVAKTLIGVVGAKQLYRNLLDIAVEHAKKYYKNPKAYDRAVMKALGYNEKTDSYDDWDDSDDDDNDEEDQGDDDERALAAGCLTLISSRGSKSSTLTPTHCC
jgi:hypothetical protein